MGKSRGERRVIFSSSGAILTTNDFRRPPIDLKAGIFLKQFEDGSRKTALEEEGLKEVEGVANIGGVEAGRMERAGNDIGGGAYKCVAWVVSAASRNGQHHIHISAKPPPQFENVVGWS